MTTVAQMIEWLQTLPQDAIVECGKEESSGYSYYMSIDTVDIDSCDVVDFRDEKWKSSYFYGKVFVHIRAQ